MYESISNGEVHSIAFCRTVRLSNTLSHRSHGGVVIAQYCLRRLV